MKGHFKCNINKRLIYEREDDEHWNKQHIAASVVLVVLITVKFGKYRFHHYYCHHIK